MAKTSLGPNNVFKPAPEWYRIVKKILYTLAGSTIVTGTLQRFGVSDSDCLLIMGWLVLLGELMGSALANGQIYATPDELNKQVIIINVDALPVTGELGVWYYNGENYFFWDGEHFVNKGGDRPDKPPVNP